MHQARFQSLESLDPGPVCKYNSKFCHCLMVSRELICIV